MSRRSSLGRDVQESDDGREAEVLGSLCVSFCLKREMASLATSWISLCLGSTARQIDSSDIGGRLSSGATILRAVAMFVTLQLRLNFSCCVGACDIAKT